MMRTLGSKQWRKHSNLESFLDSVTPSVPSHSIPKTCIRYLNSLWQPIGKETVECFNLGDLWDQYYEWSAYGLGVPVHLTNGENVVQYYVPHLSGIQIYTTKALACSRNVGDDSESDSSSDDSSESEKMSKSWDTKSDESIYELDGMWPPKDRIGQLYCQYIEYCPPYGRIPFVDKISELAQSYPGLTSFRSVDLSPASWVSISWYPIYHIPRRRYAKDLTASFLTYHTISSSFQDNITGDTQKEDEPFTQAVENGKMSDESISRISLPPFGLATYKLHGGTVWMDPEMGDDERIVSLYSAADSWLKQLRVVHHDFNFFTAHSSM